MTVPSDVSRMDYTGNGVTTAFPYTFRIFADADLVVTERDADGVETVQVLNTDYTVSGAGSFSGGTVTYISGAPASGVAVTIRRVLDLTQDTDLRNQGAYYAETIETMGDRDRMIDLQQQDEIDRALKAPETEATQIGPLPSKTERASKFMGFNANGDPVASTDAPPEGSITTAKIVDEAVTTAKIADDAVTMAKLAEMAARTVIANDTAGTANPTARLIDDLTVLADGSTTRRDLSARFADYVNVKDYGATGDGVTDDTAAIQAAVTASITKKQGVYLPAGIYLVTDTITLPVGSQIRGVTGYQYPRGFSVDPLATTILFTPASLKSLFVCSGTDYSGFRFHYHISGLAIVGNSANASGNSLYALDLDGAIYGSFENLSIQSFRVGIYCTATINNKFENIYAGGRIAAVVYDGSIETTDVWSHCSLWGSPIGVDFQGTSIGVRFANCLFEQIDTHVANIARECQSIAFVNCYAEDCPFANDANNAVFRVGFAGASLASANHLIITGGMYAGRNAGTVGSFIDADYCTGVICSGVAVSRFTNMVKTSANTVINSVVLAGLTALGITNLVTDATKVSGFYPHDVIGGANGNMQNGRLRNISVINIATVGGIAAWADNASDIGASGTRFKDAYLSRVLLGAGLLQIVTGTGNPEGVVTAPVGSLYLRTDSGGAAVFYVKTTGTGNTGWVGK